MSGLRIRAMNSPPKRSRNFSACAWCHWTGLLPPSMSVAGLPSFCIVYGSVLDARGFPSRLERRRQYLRHPRRCQRSTVSGFTMSTEVRQPTNHRHARTQKRRSASSRRGRGLFASVQDQQLLPEAKIVSAISSAVGQVQQLPTANSETLTCTPCCWTVRRLKLFNAVNRNGP